FHSSQAEHGQNYGAYRSARADALLEKIRVTEDDDARHQLDREHRRVLHEHKPYTFLSSPEVQTLYARRAHGIAPSIDGFDFAAAWVDQPRTARPPAAHGRSRPSNPWRRGASGGGSRASSPCTSGSPSSP